MRGWIEALSLSLLLGGISGCDDSSGSTESQPPAITAESGAVALGGIEGGGGSDDTADSPALNPGGTLAADMTCTPNTGLQCISESMLALCNADGTGVIQVACPSGMTCQNATCGGIIPSPPVEGSFNGSSMNSSSTPSSTPPPPPPSPDDCEVGRRYCIDAIRTGVCPTDGNEFEAIENCQAGASCRNGECGSDCQIRRKTPSYVGCEYWSVDLDNYPDPVGNPASVPHAVAISNTSAETARIIIEGPEGVVLRNAEFDIAPNDLSVFTFPRLDIDGTGIFDRAFRIRSDWPVVVYQFNPLNNEDVFSNDASLLLPAEGLGRQYVGLSWPTSPVPCLGGGSNCLPHQHGYVTIIATALGRTIVNVTPSGTVQAGGTIEELPAGVERTFELQQGEVLNLEAGAMALESFEDLLNGFGAYEIQDMSGTLISADKPIAVFGGHEEAVVGTQGNEPGEEMSSCCAEHLEQQLLPISTWGTHYLAARSEPRGGSREHWRVVAALNGTTVTTVPPQPDSASFTLDRGEFHEIISRDSFEIISTEPVMVAQYLVSQTRTEDNVGDPAMIIAPPLSQLRNSYQIITPRDYRSNWLTIARPVGAAVSLDGAPVDNALFSPFGSGQYESAYVPVEEGVHRLVGDAPFSLSVYGFSGAVSYGYPGGLNLRSDQEMPPSP